MVAGAALIAKKNIAKKKWYWARDAGAPTDKNFRFEIAERASQRIKTLVSKSQSERVSGSSNDARSSRVLSPSTP
jgi:hypothetical protein